MTFNIWIQGGIKLCYVPVKYPEKKHGRCVRLKIRGSVQVQTVLAMNDQELDRDRVVPSYQRLKTLVRRHNELMIETRNFRVRNERIETGVLVKSHKGRKVSVERKVREGHQWKVTGQCSRGDSCSFSHGSNRGQKKHNRPLVLRGRRLTKGTGPRGESLSGRNLKITLWKSLFHGKVENWDQIAPSRSPRAHGTWRKMTISARDKAHVLLPYRSMGNAGTLSKKPQEREFVTDSGASLHILGKKDLSSGELETLRKSRNPTTVSTANGHACRQVLRRARMY